MPEMYRVAQRCIGCCICSEIAPLNFRTDHEDGYANVCKHPHGTEEIELCTEAMDVCPVGAIETD